MRLQVGHNALGSGQVVEQGAKLVDESLASGAMFEYEGWQQIEAAAKSGTLHLIGLLSDGGVHSRYDQLHHILTGVCLLLLSQKLLPYRSCTCGSTRRLWDAYVQCKLVLDSKLSCC